LKKLLLKESIISPLVIFITCILTFVPQIPFLGFVLDDWMFIDFYYSQHLKGLLTYFYFDNRPMAFWPAWIGFNLFGTNPLYWQLWTLFWKIMIAIAIWLIVRKLFPDKPVQNLLLAVLFALYPVFRQQSSALQLSIHMISFCLACFSIYLTICAIKHKKYWFLFSLAALLLSLVQLLTTEFFAGFDLGRIVIIVYLVTQSDNNKYGKIRNIIKQWFPYLIIWVGWAIWRIRVMPTPGVDRNTPNVALGFFANPIGTLLNVAQMAIQDTAKLLVGVWNVPLSFSALSFTTISNIFSWFIAVVVILIVIVAVKVISSGKQDSIYQWKVVFGGLILMLAGCLPGYAIGNHIATANEFNDRFGVAATPGAVVLIVALSSLIFKNLRIQKIVLLLLIGLGVGYHIQSLAPFRYSWEQQIDFYWQLKWRAPQIMAPVALLGNGQLIDKMGDWFLSPALDHLYAPIRPTVEPMVWYFDVNDNLESRFSSDGKIIHINKYQRTFTNNSKDSLVIQYKGVKGQCVWILSAEDRYNPYVAEELIKYLPFSNIKNIQEGNDVPQDTAAFGANYRKNWCYFFQKAQLAEQYGKWDTILELWTQAVQQGFQPNVSTEYIPFIKAAGATGNWDLALAITQKAYTPTSQMHDILCQSWGDISKSFANSRDGNDAVQKANNNLSCNGLSGN
jgi:hypothetical protein